MLQTKFHIHTEPQAKLQFCVIKFLLFQAEGKKKKDEDKMLASIIRIKSPFKFLLNLIFPNYLNCAIFSNDLLSTFLLRFCPALCRWDTNVYLFFCVFTSTSTSLQASI
jgi:hypothetical protein